MDANNGFDKKSKSALFINGCKGTFNITARISNKPELTVSTSDG